MRRKLVERTIYISWTRENRLTPSIESFKVGLANRTYRGKTFCACNSLFLLPDSDIVTFILYSWAQMQISMQYRNSSYPTNVYKKSSRNPKFKLSNKMYTEKYHDKEKTVRISINSQYAWVWMQHA